MEDILIDGKIKVQSTLTYCNHMPLQSHKIIFDEKATYIKKRLVSHLIKLMFMLISYQHIFPGYHILGR